MERNTIINLSLILFYCIGFAQKHIILDSIKKEIIPFVSVKFMKSQDGFYSNDKGYLFIKGNEKDTLQVSCLGYKTIICPVNSLRDTILLVPEPIKLEEVVINKTKTKKETFGLKRKKINFHINPNFQIGLLIQPTTGLVGKYLDNILIPINKKHFFSNKERESKDFLSVFKLTIYSNELDLPKYPLIEKPIDVYVTQKSKDFISIDLSDTLIKFSEEGVFICIEMVGEINNAGDVINSKNPRPSFVFSNKAISEFNSKSYYKSKFNNKWEPMYSEKFHLEEDVFLAISITLSSHE